MDDPTPTGSPETILVYIRGNSGSGKSSIARALRHRHGCGCALVEQDHLRRILLRDATNQAVLHPRSSPRPGAGRLMLTNHGFVREHPRPSERHLQTADSPSTGADTYSSTTRTGAVAPPRTGIDPQTSLAPLCRTFAGPASTLESHPLTST